MTEDKRKKELADLCNPKKQVWNPFGEYSDFRVERKVEQTDSLTRFINSCSPNIRGREVMDTKTGKYVRYSSSCSYAPNNEKNTTPPQNSDNYHENL